MTKMTRQLSRASRHKRVRATIVGTPERPRLNVYRSLAHIYVQVTDDSTGNTLVSASTIDAELRAQMEGKKKSEQAKLVGQAVAARAKAQGLNPLVFARGEHGYPGRVKAVADGAREGGLEF